jgi:hypothetical protein
MHHCAWLRLEIFVTAIRETKMMLHNDIAQPVRVKILVDYSSDGEELTDAMDIEDPVELVDVFIASDDV